MKTTKLLLTAALALLLAGCVTTTINSLNRAKLSGQVNWGVLPFSNHTSVPLAADRAAAITHGLILARGVQHVYLYPRTGNCNNLISCNNQMPSKRSIRAWVRKYNIRYLVKGSVNEWRYKVGLDGEPAANVALQIVNANTHTILWNSVGSKTGGSRSGLSNIGQLLINQMLASIKVY